MTPEAVQAALRAYYDNDNEYDENFADAMQAALEAAFPIMLREVAETISEDQHDFPWSVAQSLRQIADSHTDPSS